MQAGGFALFDSIPHPSMWRELRSEAAGGVRRASLSAVEDPDDTEVRGGNPARRFLQTSGGKAQDLFYQSAEVAKLLSALCGVPVVPSGLRGTYSYYVEPNHHLALHRDIETCDVAVITCICAPSSCDAGALCVYPSRCRDLLSDIRASQPQGLVRLPLRTGQSVILLGGIVPHLVQPLAVTQPRVVSVLCYRAVIS